MEHVLLVTQYLTIKQVTSSSVRNDISSPKTKEWSGGVKEGMCLTSTKVRLINVPQLEVMFVIYPNNQNLSELQQCCFSYLCCLVVEQRFFNYAGNKELEQVNLSNANGTRSHVRAAEGQEVQRVFRLHSNLSQKRRRLLIRTYPFDLTLLTPPSGPLSSARTDESSDLISWSD